MGPAGRAEAIHFPSATPKAASREGGGGRKNEIEEKSQREQWGDVLYVLAKRWTGSDLSRTPRKDSDSESRKVRNVLNAAPSE